MLDNIEKFFIENETVSVIGEFSIVWAMMEEKYFDKDCNAGKLNRTTVLQANVTLADHAKKIKESLKLYYSSYDDSHILKLLNFRRKDSFNLRVQYFLMTDLQNLDENVFCALCICFRIRNNLFHGEKVFYMLNNQRSLIADCSAFLNELLNSELSITC